MLEPLIQVGSIQVRIVGRREGLKRALGPHQGLHGDAQINARSEILFPRVASTQEDENQQVPDRRESLDFSNGR